MERKTPTNYLIYETSYGSDIPIEQMFVHMFDVLPSKYVESKKYSIEILQYFQDKGYVLQAELTQTSRRHEKPVVYLYLLNKERQTAVQLQTSHDKNDNYYSLSLYYNVERAPFNVNFELEEIEKFVVKLKKSGINLVKVEMGHLDTEEYDLNVPDIDLGLNYGSEFEKIHNVIVKRLNAPHDKGIVLFHGDPGTGKTSYLKYLTRLIEDKEILFIPPSMAESLSEPSIIPFLMEHKNSILIIEDAERVIADREGNGSSAGVSNILNLTDGILGDCLNIQIVATFNMKREKIDQALLRKGRLIAEHKFTALNVDDSNKLLKSLGKEKTVDKPTTLADIYNIDEEVYKTENKTNIGFKNN